MKVVNTGPTYRIFTDDLKTYDQLPAGNYKVDFSPLTGFYLEKIDNFNNNERAYGKHPEKIRKSMNLFEKSTRSVGIMLSGRKGMGKSLFARTLSEAFAQAKGIPTIVVSEPYQGIVDFLESIKQECIVLFDEFEKVFDNSEGTEHQDRLLGLFDGISQTKRLYVITANNTGKISEFMLNRPGRFHYHFQFPYPSLEEVAEYLTDKLKPEFHNQIALVQRFSNRFDLNYDSLRAIAFELNNGYSFLETMEDLNISGSDSETLYYDVEIYHSDGRVAKTRTSLDLMSRRDAFSYYIENADGEGNNEFVRIVFSPLEVEIEDKRNFTVHPDKVNLDISYDSDNEVYDGKTQKVTRIVFRKEEFSSKVSYGKEMEGVLV